MSLVPGSRLGAYEILGPLGSGGMGEVYRARDTKLGREVAIKILPERLAADREFLGRFEKEAKLASSLNHPNIITIHEIGQSGATHYIVMELVDGETLQEIMTAGPMPLESILAVAAQIASGLAKAHEAEIVHRDLKPRNVMRNRDGLVKILDFGLGKVAPPITKSETEMTTWVPEGDVDTRPGAILGTVDYMSPQQAAGRFVDFRSDQFSFGLILYEMLTGKRPFHRETAAQTMSAIIEKEPEPITLLRPEIPAPLREIVKRCLAKDPRQRYASTRELMQALKSLQTSLLTGTLPIPQPPIPHRLPRWGAWPGVLLLAAFLAAGAIFLLPSFSVRLPLAWQSSSLPAEKQLAVLPFANVGNDPANQPLCDGLVEILSSKLSQLEQFQRALQVVPASEVRREGVSGIREARRVFGVTLVVSGSVQRAEDRLRVTINLVDAQTLRQLKAHSFDTEVHDIAVLQDGIVLKVAELLEIDLPEQAQQVLAAGGTTVPGAYEYYMQGRGYLQRYEDAENVETAIGLFRRAAEQDSQYALAYAGLCEAYWRQYELTKNLRRVEEARSSCRTATGLNNRLAQVHATLGMIDTGTGQYEAAVEKLQHALELDPVNPDASREMAKAYEALKKLPEAESTYKKAIAIRPSFWGSHNDLGRFYYRLGRYAEAEVEFLRVVGLTPDNARAYNQLGAIYINQKRYDDAAAMFEKSVAIMPTDYAYSNLATVYFYQERYADAARTYEQALKINDRNYKWWHNLATAHQWTKETEKMRAAYQRVAELAERERRVNPRDANLLWNLADAYSMLDQPGRARDLLRQALTLAPQDVELMFQAAAIYEQLGDRERALEWLGKAIQKGFSRDLIERSPSLAQLRADPRYRTLRSP